MTKEQARVFVKAEKNKMTPAQIHENSRQIIDRLISQVFFYSAVPYLLMSVTIRKWKPIPLLTIVFPWAKPCLCQRSTAGI